MCVFVVCGHVCVCACGCIHSVCVQPASMLPHVKTSVSTWATIIKDKTTDGKATYQGFASTWELV